MIEFKSDLSPKVPLVNNPLSNRNCCLSNKVCMCVHQSVLDDQVECIKVNTGPAKSV